MRLLLSFLKSTKQAPSALSVTLNIIYSVTTNDCKHLVVDAGHISIESALADKDAIRTIHLKRNQKYNDDDYKYLESLMYDKLLLRLEAAQVLKISPFQSFFIITDRHVVHCWKQPSIMP